MLRHLLFPYWTVVLLDDEEKSMPALRRYLHVESVKLIYTNYGLSKSIPVTNEDKLIFGFTYTPDPNLIVTFHFS